MPANRFFTPNRLEGELTLTGDEAHHLTRAMRVAVGQQVELINGQGSLAQAEVIGTSKRQVEVRVLSLHQEPPPPPTFLLQAIPRQGPLSTLVEKGTELGATHFLFFPAEWGERDTLSANGLERCRAIAIAAMKQSGALYLPTFALHPPLAKTESLPAPAFFGSLEPSAEPFSPRASEILFVVGPESGFSPVEEEKLRQLGAQGVKLAPYTLRTETAAISALSLIARARL